MFKDSPKGQTHCYELKFCKKCEQMTNHIGDVCQKCKNKPCEHPAGFEKIDKHTKQCKFCKLTMCEGNVEGILKAKWSEEPWVSIESALKDFEHRVGDIYETMAAIRYYIEQALRL